MAQAPSFESGSFFDVEAQVSVPPDQIQPASKVPEIPLAANPEPEAPVAAVEIAAADRPRPTGLRKWLPLAASYIGTGLIFTGGAMIMVFVLHRLGHHQMPALFAWMNFTLTSVFSVIYESPLIRQFFFYEAAEPGWWKRLVFGIIFTLVGCLPALFVAIFLY